MQERKKRLIDKRDELFLKVEEKRREQEEAGESKNGLSQRGEEKTIGFSPERQKRQGSQMMD